MKLRDHYCYLVKEKLTTQNSSECKKGYVRKLCKKG